MPGKPLSAGRLSKVVTIQSPTVTRDAAGEPIETWSAAAGAPTRAEIRPMTQAEQWFGEEVVAVSSHKVTMRYWSGIDPQQRLLYGNRLFSIKGIVTPEEMHGAVNEMQIAVVEIVSYLSFTVIGPTASYLGNADLFTVTAQNAGNQVMVNYAGTVAFTSSDGAATLPANSTLTSGVGVFSVLFGTVGTQTLTATDLVSPAVNGQSAQVNVILISWDSTTITWDDAVATWGAPVITVSNWDSATVSWDELSGTWG